MWIRGVLGRKGEDQGRSGGGRVSKAHLSKIREISEKILFHEKLALTKNIQFYHLR